MRFLVTSIFLYACESRSLTAELQRRIRAMEMRCYRKIQCLSYKDHVTSKEFCAKIYQAIGPQEDSDHRKETQPEMVWTYLPFIRSGQNHLARHSEREKMRRQTEKETERQNQGMDRPGVRQISVSARTGLEPASATWWDFGEVPNF